MEVIAKIKRVSLFWATLYDMICYVCAAGVANQKVYFSLVDIVIVDVRLGSRTSPIFKNDLYTNFKYCKM